MLLIQKISEPKLGLLFLYYYNSVFWAKYFFGFFQMCSSIHFNFKTFKSNLKIVLGVCFDLFMIGFFSDERPLNFKK